MTTSVGIYVFPEAEVLDFAGPYEVFTTASRVFKRTNPSEPEPFTVFTVAQAAGTVRARAGLVVTPDYTFANHPAIDLVVIPGGVVTAELDAPAVKVWIAGIAAMAKLTASVCTGSFLLAQAGLLEGKSATTHWEDVSDLRAMFPSLTVYEERRWVDEGAIVTSAILAKCSLHTLDLMHCALRDLTKLLIALFDGSPLNEKSTSISVGLRNSIAFARGPKQRSVGSNVPSDCAAASTKETRASLAGCTWRPLPAMPQQLPVE